MQPNAVLPFEAWANFYVIVGSSAAALTGLQFVVLTLIAQASPMRGREETIAAFGSPNVVHFCAALLVAAIFSAPWGATWQAGIPLALCGFGGLVYSAAVLRRARRQSGYQPVFEDWVWHNALPILAYLAVLLGGILLRGFPRPTSFVIAAADLLLVFVGIHNAWDTVTYVTSDASRRASPAVAAAAKPTASAPATSADA